MARIKPKLIDALRALPERHAAALVADTTLLGKRKPFSFVGSAEAFHAVLLEGTPDADLPAVDDLLPALADHKVLEAVDGFGYRLKAVYHDFAPAIAFGPERMKLAELIRDENGPLNGADVLGSYRLHDGTRLTVTRLHCCDGRAVQLTRTGRGREEVFTLPACVWSEVLPDVTKALEE